jgi:hypothetical protein
MGGAAIRASDRGFAPQAGDEGGNASFCIDKVLRLAPGVARRRRLFATTLQDACVAGTELVRGDVLIIEPGLRLIPTCLVAGGTRRRIVPFAVQRGSDTGWTLTPIDPSRPPSSARESVHSVGSVVAAVRGWGGALRVALAPAYRFTLSALGTRVGPVESTRAQQLRDAEVIAHAVRVCQNSNTQGRDDRSPLIRTEATRLRTLIGCVRAVRHPALRRALLLEVARSTARLRWTAARRARSASSSLADCERARPHSCSPTLAGNQARASVLWTVPGRPLRHRSRRDSANAQRQTALVDRSETGVL